MPTLVVPLALHSQGLIQAYYLKLLKAIRGYLELGPQRVAVATEGQQLFVQALIALEVAHRQVC